jgi:hypothetical protein
MKIHKLLGLAIFTAAAFCSSFPVQGFAQSASGAGTNTTGYTQSSSDMKTRHQTQASRLGYVRPSKETRLHNYLFDAFGPYPLMGAAIVGGINQADNTPPEWGQGAGGYGRRVGSNYGIAAVSATTRYALSEVLHEDTLYYRCACTGFFPRLGHALVSTLISRRGDEGHRIFSVPALVAPYAGTMTATYGWFPGRYGAKDAFRMGNYNLLALAGGNVAIEFLYRGPHSFLSKIYLNNRHAAPVPEPDN